MKIETVMWLLPAAFMIHDFEEIIFMNAWMSRSEKELGKKFPRIAARMIPQMKNISTSSFTLAVAEEFILLCAAVLVMEEFSWYSAFAGLLGAYTIHLIVHFIQAAVFRGYIPAIVTSLITGVYCIWAFHYFSQSGLVNWSMAAVWSAGLFAVLAVNVALVHFLARRFELFLRRWAGGGS